MAPQFLQFIERARPVGAQEPGKAAIGEHPTAGLADRAVVRFVVRIADAENFRAAPPLRDAKFGRTALSRSYDDLYIVP
jgi:hypothetical protein